MKLSTEYIVDRVRDLISAPWIKLGGALLTGLLVGAILFNDNAPRADVELPDAHTAATVWTCSMHPQIHLDEPGQCPICFMDLIPLTGSTEGDGPGHISLSPAAVELAHVMTTAVRRGPAHAAIQLSGRIESDETRVKTISAWFPGRMERLYVDYTGIRVSKGDHLLDIYSPDLYAVQEELLQAYRRLKQTEKTSAPYQNASSAYAAVREKTRLMGLEEPQIESILKQGQARSVLQINSPITGIVTHKNAVEGKYVKTGDQIYTIVDLSQVWLILEAYEKDLSWLAYGQELVISVAGLPGRTFTANVSYIDPLLDPLKRSVSVRAVLSNDGGLLKPGMLAEATIKVELNGLGEVVTPELAGKWTCPMHPEELSSRPGKCGICGMDLIPVEKLTGTHALASDALLVPASAVLKTGKRAIVYVEASHEGDHIYELREVILGPRVGDEYMVLDGLQAGEQVVSNGNFKIDSAMQIAGKQSMMSGDVLPKPAGSPEFRDALTPIYESYLMLQSALAKDDLVAVQVSEGDFLAKLKDLAASKEAKPAGWSGMTADLLTELQVITAPQTLLAYRSRFETVSNYILAIQKQVGHANDRVMYEIFCPMAFDNKGASWFQAEKQVSNPYFGSAMLRCGEVTHTLMPTRASHE